MPQTGHNHAPAIEVGAWSDFYPDALQIEAPGQTRNHRHEIVEGYAPIEGLSAIACAVRFTRGTEAMEAGVPTGSASYAVKLQGFYPAIARQHRASVTDGATGEVTAYEIAAVAHTSGKSRTKLICTLAS